MPAGMFSPQKVSLGETPSGIQPNRTANAPFVSTRPVARPQPPAAPAQGTGGVLGSESVRATQGGPFDQAYRQNLATFAGGGFQRPGGNLTFDPTATVGAPDSLFGNLGGAGPTDLLSSALGGGGWRFPNPTPPTGQNMNKKKPARDPLQWWGNQASQSGSLMR